MDDFRIGNDRVEGHVVCGERQRVHFLARVGQAHESWPGRARPEYIEGAIVETAAHAEAPAAPIEADQGQEHQIQRPGCDHGRISWFGNAVAIADHGGAGPNAREVQARVAEGHGVDHGKVHARASVQQSRCDRGRIDLAVRRQIERDSARMQQQRRCEQSSEKLERSGVLPAGIDRTSPTAQLTSQTCAAEACSLDRNLDA